MCVGVCVPVLYNKLCVRHKDGRETRQNLSQCQRSNKQTHTHRRTHAQDVSVSWTHKATHRGTPLPPLLCTAHVHQLVAMPRSLAASSTLWPFIRYVLYLCLPTLMVLMPFVLAHPAGTHSPPPPHDIHLCQPGTHTHTDCKGSKGIAGEHKKCSVCVSLNSRAGQGSSGRGGAGKRAGAEQRRGWGGGQCQP